MGALRLSTKRSRCTDKPRGAGGGIPLTYVWEGGGRVFSRYFRSPSLPTLTLFCLAMTSPLIAQNNPSIEPRLSEEQEKQFLLHAKVTNSGQTSRGVTNPWRLTLTDGTLTHDAIFQPIDERKPLFQGSDGHSELNFRDSRLIGFSQDADKVRATVLHDGRTEETEVEYICGCDGAHSCVRETLGIGFPGGTYEQLFTWPT
jgi:hypothetical protein